MRRFVLKNKFSEKLSNLFEKIKESKKIQIAIILSIVLIILAYYFISTAKTTSSSTSEQINSTSEYVEYIEDKLENTIRSIDQVTSVNVNVSLESGFEYVYATNDETKTTSSGTLSSSDLVLVSGQPVLLKEIYPKIQGVVVVVNNVDIKTRLSILEAIQTVLEISNEKITIIS